MQPQLSQSGNQWQPRHPPSTNQWQPLSPWRPQAHVSTTDTTTSPNWLLDSGTSHDVTLDLANLSPHKPYK